MRQLVSMLTILGILFLITAELKAAKVKMPELFYQVKTDLVSPHIPWAKPYYRGKKLKALVFAPRFTHRETVELMERMDITCVPILLRNEREIYLAGWDWGLENVARVKKIAVLDEINKALEDDYDVIIMGKVATAKMPAEILDKIEKKVKSGTGLIYVYYNRHPNTKFEKSLITSKTSDGMRYIANGVPFEQLKGFSVRPGKTREKDLQRLISLYKLGSGRIAFVNYPRNSKNLYMTPSDPVELTYEYYQSFLIKTVLWAANREADLIFEDFPIDIQSDDLAFKLVKNGDKIPSNLSAIFSIRSSKRFYDVPSGPVVVPGVYQTETQIRPIYQKSSKIDSFDNKTSVKFNFPNLPKGDYFADVEILSGDKKVNWAAATITSKPDVYISEITCDPMVIDCAENKRVPITVQFELNKPVTEKSHATLDLIDNYDRILARHVIVLPKNSAKAKQVLSVSCDEIVCALLTVRAELCVGKVVKSVETVELTTIHRPFPDFTFFAWGGGDGDYLANMVIRANASTGVVDAYRTNASIAKLKTADMRFVPDIVRFFGKVKDKKVMSHPDPFWGNIEYRRDLFKKVSKSVESGLKFDTYAHLLGDEMALLHQPAEICAGNIEDFRTYLRLQYKTIDKLNSEWNSSYHSFDEIQPITRNEMGEKAAKDKDYAPLIDLWMFNYWVFADTVRVVKKIQDEIDPLSRIGASTPLWNWWWRGYYWEKIAPHLDFFTPYYTKIEGDSAQIESAISFAPGLKLSGHAGSYILTLTNEEYYSVLPHAMLLKGFCNFFWYFMHPGTEGSLSPSFDHYPQTLNTIKEVKTLKSGLGKLILESKKKKREIAVVYSTPSYLFSFLASGPHVSWNANSAVVNLNRLGYQVDFVSPEQVVKNKLSDYKVVILPVTQCLSDIEAMKIKEFVQSGGLLIADVRPGIADEHGKAREQSALSEVFGVKWNKPLSNPMQSIEMIPKNKQVEQTMTFAFDGSFENRQFTGPPIENLVFDPSIELDGANACVSHAFTQEDVDKLERCLDKMDKKKTKEISALTNRIQRMKSSLRSVPFITYNKYSKGLAVCLNAPFNSIPISSNILDVFLSFSNIDNSLIVEKGCDDFRPGKWIPAFSFDQYNDEACSYYGIVKFKDDKFEDEGSNAYYGVVKSQTGDAQEKTREYKVLVNFGRAGHLYEPLTGKYRGLKENVTDTFGAWEAKWFSLLPYKVEGLNISLENKTSTPGKVIKGKIVVLTENMKPQRHVINIQVLDKGGNSIAYLAQTLNTRAGAVSFEIPTALNDDVKDWTLVFKDAATGISEKTKLKTTL